MNVENLANKEFNVGIYIRLSKEDGDKEESESVTNQRKILKTYINENKNFQFYKEYIDDGYSGTNFDRPGFKKMLKDIEDGKVNLVIVKSLSRLGRDYIDTGKYIEKYFPEHNIRFISILDDVDTFLDKNVESAAFKNIMNDYYAKETSKAVRKTKNRKKKEGFYYTSIAPFGYEKIDKAGHLKIKEDQADIVRRIFDMFVTKGLGNYRISVILNNEGILPPGLQMNLTNALKNKTGTTNKWTHTTVKRILMNPVYIGTIVQNKTKKLSYKSKKVIPLSTEDMTIMAKHHEAIIDEYTFRLAEKILKSSKSSKITVNDQLLKGLLYCDHCNNKMAFRRCIDKYKNTVTVRQYIYCAVATRKISNKTCYRNYINYDKFENVVIEKIANVLKEYFDKGFDYDKAMQKLEEFQRKEDNSLEKLKTIRKDKEVINKKIATIYNDKLSGILEEQDYISFSKNFHDERCRLEEVEKKIEMQILEYKNRSNKIEPKMKNAIKELVEEKKFTKEILHELIEKIDIDKDKNVTIHFTFYELNCIGVQYLYDDGKNASNE